MRPTRIALIALAVAGCTPPVRYTSASPRILEHDQGTCDVRAVQFVPHTLDMTRDALAYGVYLRTYVACMAALGWRLHE